MAQHELPEGLKRAIDKALADGRTPQEIVDAVDPRLAEGAKRYMGAQGLQSSMPEGMGGSASSSAMARPAAPPPPVGTNPPRSAPTHTSNQLVAPMPSDQAPDIYQDDPPPPPTTVSVRDSSSMAGAPQPNMMTRFIQTVSTVASTATSREEREYKMAGKSASSMTDGSQPIHRREYEICLVFPFKASEETEASKRDVKESMMKSERESVLKTLQNCGLLVFCFYSRDRDEVFCKVGAPAQKLKDTAARMKYKLQLKPEYLSGYAEYRNDFPGRPENKFRDARKVSHIYKTFGHEDYPSEDAIFSTRDKIALIHHIISAKDRDCAGINVGKMLHEGELKAYFPLHEESLVMELSSTTWAIFDWLVMSKNHACKVRDYFGEKVALYFLFMSYYWKAWLVPAVVGIALQIIDTVVKSPDNITAVPFCIFISVWSVLLPHFWRRQETKFSILWGTLNLVPELETYRPSFYGEMMVNPITNQKEPFYPWRWRAKRYFCSLVVIAMTSLAFMFFVLISLFLRHLSKDYLPENVRSHRIIFFQFGLAILVEVTNTYFNYVAERLNDWENHRTQTEYERHLLVKVMVFKFLNCYFVLYYVAFFKKQLNLFGMKCWRDDCFLDLQSQLAAFVVIRLTLSNATEYLFPKLLACCRGFSERKKTIIASLGTYAKLEVADMSSAEAQSKKEEHDSFSEFDDVLIAHGYASFFAVTSPWVCAATLLWVIVECVLDVKGLCENRRRPLPLQVRNNEPWNTAFEMYGFISAVTNITLLVFASSQYSGNKFTEKLFLWIYLLHLIFIFKVITVWALPEVPGSVETLRLMQEQKAHKCLENITVEPDQGQDFTTRMRYQRYQRNEEYKPSEYDQQNVRDQDYHDRDAEDPDPHLQLGRSAKGFGVGVREGLPWYVVFIFLASFIAGIVTIISLRVFHVYY